MVLDPATTEVVMLSKDLQTLPYLEMCRLNPGAVKYGVTRVEQFGDNYDETWTDFK